MIYNITIFFLFPEEKAKCRLHKERKLRRQLLKIVENVVKENGRLQKRIESLEAQLACNEKIIDETKHLVELLKVITINDTVCNFFLYKLWSQILFSGNAWCRRYRGINCSKFYLLLSLYFLMLKCKMNKWIIVKNDE